MSVRRVGNVYWGFIFIFVGALLLARNLGYPIPFWSGVARYWPILIIVWGLLKLADYYRMKRAGQAAPLFSGGEVALLIIVILIGSAITTAANISPAFGDTFQIGDLDLWDITGNNFEYSEHHETAVPAEATIEIINMFGNVDVRPSDTDHVILDVKKTVRASSKEEADRLSSEFTFTISNDGSMVRIASSQEPNRPGRRLIGRQRFNSSLTVQVPKRSPLRLDNRNGAVSIQDLAGSQTVMNRYGEVEVRGVEGDLEVTNSFGEIRVRDVTGAITVKGRFGDVRLDLQSPPQKDISLSLEFGDVRLGLPSNSSFGLEARTAFGDVRSEFGNLTEDSSERQRGRARGLARSQIGEGGPQINVETRFGDIRLQKRG